MADVHKWAEALKINPKKLEEWSALAPDGIPLVVWLLQEGHVPTSDYLAWAREHYALPVVQSTFFDSTFNIADARELATKGHEDWRPWYFPLEQWDGLTLIGCVEPPAQPADNHQRYILADAQTLLQVWSKMANSFAEPSSSDDAPPIPHIDVPIGMSHDTAVKPFTLNLDSPDLFTGTDLKPEASAKQAKNAPPPPPPPAVRATGPTTAPATAKAKSPVPTNENANQTILKVFSGLTEIYKHVVIMKCANGLARLYKWDANLKPKNGGKNAQVDLAFPTFLRIVSKTGMPYHGYLVDSPAHRDFFNELSIADLPGCVTAVPIKHGQDLVGVLVGIGDDRVQKMNLLPKVEEAAEELAATMASTLADAA